VNKQGKEVKTVKIPFMKHMAWYLVIVMFMLALVPRVDAGFAPSEIVALTEVDRNADLEKIQKVLETKAIQGRLAQLGLTQEEIQKRFDQLSDEQIHQIVFQLDDLRVGKDALGIVIALLVIAILVVLLLQLTGHKVIVTK